MLGLFLERGDKGCEWAKHVISSLGGVLSKVYRTEVSPEEYLAYTTEEKEKVKVQAYAAKFGGDIEKGINALADEIIHSKNW